MIESIWVVLFVGFLLGTPAGFSPGPMLVLVISESLRNGVRAGAKVAFIPLITDIPLLIFSGIFFTKISNIKTLIGLISIIGSVFLFYLGRKSFRIEDSTIQKYYNHKILLKELIILNFLNPNPYLFWFTVGAPLMVRSFDQSPISGISFLLGFYIGLVGSKFCLALITGKSRNFLQDFWYKLIMKFLGLSLIGLSIYILIDGLDLLGIF